jgi:hypothetical protein
MRAPKEPERQAEMQPGMMLEMYLLFKYGPRLTVAHMAETLGKSESDVRNKLVDGEFGIPTYLDGKQRYADYRDVAIYLEECRKEAART